MCQDASPQSVDSELLGPVGALQQNPTVSRSISGPKPLCLAKTPSMVRTVDEVSRIVRSAMAVKDFSSTATAVAGSGVSSPGVFCDQAPILGGKIKLASCSSNRPALFETASCWRRAMFSRTIPAREWNRASRALRSRRSIAWIMARDRIQVSSK